MMVQLAVGVKIWRQLRGALLPLVRCPTYRNQHQGGLDGCLQRRRPRRARLTTGEVEPINGEASAVTVQCCNGPLASL